MIPFFKILSHSLNLLPKHMALGLGKALGRFIYFLGFRKKIVQDNLNLALGNKYSAEELKKIQKRNYEHYGMVLIEILQSMTWDKKKYQERVVVHGAENYHEYCTPSQGGIFLTSHLGNWELAIGGAIAGGIPMDVVLKKAKSPRAQAFLDWYRAKTGAGIFFESGSTSQILGAIGRGRIVVFVMDQFMGPPIGLPVNFFGHLAGTAVGLALFSEKSNMPIFPAYSYRESDGTIHIIIEKPIQWGSLSPDRSHRYYQKTQRLNNELERVILKHPEQWLWIHRRWKAYRGVPRWVIALLIFALTGCTSSPPPTSPTGIELPSDPTISAPEFKPQTQTEVPVVAVEEKPEVEQAVVKAPVKKIAKPKKKLDDIPKGFTVIPPDRIPFEIGERLEVDLNWMGLTAGRAVLEVREGMPFSGRPTYQLWGNVLSSKLVDAIYHIDNTIESYVDRAGLVPYKFLLHMFETHQKKETRVSFDHPKKTAYYWARRISEKWGNENVDRPDPIPLAARDMFSALYFARVVNYSLNQKYHFPIYENGQNFDVELVAVGNELVTTKVGAFQCWKVQVTVKLNNILKQTGDIFMWLSDDSKKYLVKFDAKIKIGSLYGNLVSVRERK